MSSRGFTVGGLLALSLVVVLLASASLEASQVAGADYVFSNGKVYTMDSARPWAEAVAVRGREIVYVGTTAGVAPYLSPSTRRVDLAGGMLMPGFIDGHNHLLAGGAWKMGINLAGTRSKQEMLDRIRRYVAAHPERKSYLGFGWMFTTFGSHEGTRQDLDAICPDKPMFLFNEDTHQAWFNTCAMQRAGVNRTTPDPVPGGSFYSREADGTPRGLAYEPEAWLPIGMAGGFFGGTEMLREVADALLPLVPTYGITACHDMGMWAPNLADGWKGYELLVELEKAGRLPCRIVGTYATREVDDAPSKHVARLREWNQRYRSDLVQVTGLKVWVDGTFLSHTGVQLEPYADRPGLRGESKWTTDVLARWIAAAHEAGFDVHMHVDGDGAVRRCLEALEKVAGGVGGGRFRDVLHHAGLIHPDDVPRIQALGMGVNGTPVWLVDYKGQYREAVRILGQPKVTSEFQVHRSLMERGINVSFGSDLPGVDPWEIAPLFQIQAAVTGQVPGAPSTCVPPASRLPTLEQMLRAHTMAGAWQMRLEKQIGSIEVGKKADLIVLDRNLFDVPPGRIAATKVVLTMVNGRVVAGADHPAR